MPYLALLLSFIPAGLWILYYQRQDAKYPEPWFLILRAFAYGGLLALFILTIDAWGSSRQLSLFLGGEYINLWQVLLRVAILEETTKAVVGAALMIHNRRQVDQVIDAIMYTTSIAVGFACVENVIYFVKFYPQLTHAGAWWVYVYRSVTTMLAHSVFTGVFGFFIGRYLLAWKALIARQPDLKAFRLNAPWHHILIFKNLRALWRNGWKLEDQQVGSGLVIEGWLIMVGLHLLYNALLNIRWGNYDLSFLAVPVVGVAAWWLYDVLHRPDVVAVQ